MGVKVNDFCLVEASSLLYGKWGKLSFIYLSFLSVVITKDYSFWNSVIIEFTKDFLVGEIIIFLWEFILLYLKMYSTLIRFTSFFLGVLQI